MEKINFNLMLSLKESCFRRVAIILWTRPSTSALIHLNSTEDKVVRDMLKLDLPPLLRKQMKYVVEPIKSEILGWIEFHESYLCIAKVHLYKYIYLLCWTNLGAVHYRKSAEKLIHHEILNVNHRYKLACMYCLDGYISILWEKLPEKSKRYFYSDSLSRLKTPSLEFCWPYILKGEDTQLRVNNISGRPLENPTTLNQIAFEYSACVGSKAATEYFFRKLTDTEREVSLLNSSDAVLDRLRNVGNRLGDSYSLSRRNDTFCYLLSLMSVEMQMEFLRQHSYDVFVIFLQWPIQVISLAIAEIICPYLKEEEYTTALRMIPGKIEAGFNHTKLFHELFINGSNDFKKQFVEEECFRDTAFHSLYKLEDSETIKLIFRAVDSEDKKKLVFSGCFLKHFYESILRGKCNMVKLCLREATLSNEDIDGLKKAFFYILLGEELLVFLRGILLGEEFPERERSTQEISTGKSLSGTNSYASLMN